MTHLDDALLLGQELRRAGMRTSVTSELDYEELAISQTILPATGWRPPWVHRVRARDLRAGRG